MWQVLWRWHFLAGMFVIPFALFLSLTGAVYLVAPHVEFLWNQKAYDVKVSESLLSWETQKNIVTEAYPHLKIQRIHVPETLAKGEGRPSSLVELANEHRKKYLVSLDPYTGAILQYKAKEQTVLRRLRKLHGELLLGSWGTKLVELTACWMILLIFSGLYLWWKKPIWYVKWSSWKQLFKRKDETTKATVRLAWKELHVVLGFYTSIFLLIFLLTGLPWTSVWGEGLKYVQNEIGQKAPPGRFFNPYQSQQNNASQLLPLSTDSIVLIGQKQGINVPTIIEFPKGPSGSYTLHHKTMSPINYRTLHLDQYTGKVIRNISFEDYPVLARWISIGILIHQGEYFGTANFIWALGVVFCTVFLCISAVCMWWLRKPNKSKPGKAISRGLYGILFVMGVVFPLVGLSLVLYIIIVKGMLFFNSEK